MDWAHSSKLAGAGAAFVLLIAWMVPPTTPKPPEQAAWRTAAKAHQGGSPELDRFASGGVPASIYGTSQAPVGELAPRAVGRPAPAPSRVSPSQNELADRDDDDSSPAVVIDHRYDDDQPSDADRYRSGYAWAANMQVQDPRECRRWRGDGGEDGCLDFIREQYDRDDRERWTGN